MWRFAPTAILLLSIVQVIELKQVSCVDTSVTLGILVAAANGTSEVAFCLGYFPCVSTLPSTRDDARFVPFEDLTPSTGCDPSDIEQPRVSIDGKVVALDLPNCTLAKKAINVQQNGASGLIVVIPLGPVPQGLISFGNESDYSNVNISLTVISQKSLEHLQSLGPSVRVLQYAPIEGSHMDYSLVVIWLMAMLSVTLGSVWSRKVSFYLGKAGARSDGSSELDGSQGNANRARVRAGFRKSEEQPLIVTSILIVCFVVCMCGMLLLLYFFYNSLVYVIIALFCLAATKGLYECLEPFVLSLPFGRYRLPTCSATRCLQIPDVRLALLAIGCVTLSVSWFNLRKESFSWILQDIMGIAFIINLLRIARLPSFKICTILLILLFFYDIFFVFITPLLTKNGESIMVEVATGGSSQEQMPMVLKVPHLGDDPLAFCSLRYSMLGFGDMLVPGLLVAYCYSFDVDKDARKIYFLAVLTAYGVGLLITYVGLYLMKIAQPALLYLVPCMLIPVTLIALCRREFRQFWTGDIDEDDSSAESSARTSPSLDTAENESPQSNLSNLPSQKIVSNSETSS